MVDIIKILPHTVTSFSSNTREQRSRVFTPQVTLPKYFQHVDYCPQHDRINNHPTTRWLGSRPSNPPPRILDVSQAPYSLHRKIMYHELSRQYPATIDLTKSTKSKQQSSTKEPAITPVANGAANITPQPSLPTGDAQSSRLFDTLAKHVTVKPEPLRPLNSFIYNSANTLTSWQRYWTSTHAQRRRKEATDPDPVLYRPRCEPSIPSRTHFVVLRDSPFPPSEAHQCRSRTPTPTNTDAVTKIYNPTITSDKQITSTKEDENKKAAPHVSTIGFVASSLIPSGSELNPSATVSKSTAIAPSKPREKEDDKHPIEKSVLLSSSLYFRSNSELIEEVSKSQFEPKPIANKVFRLALPDEKPKQTKNLLPNDEHDRKSAEKKAPRAPSASKRKRPASSNRKSANKSELSSMITTVSRSKYSQRKWDQPYVGLRFDPPTPPCSPSLCIHLQDSDPDDHEASYEIPKISDNSPSKVCKN